jgi:hypothetical protein
MRDRGEERTVRAAAERHDDSPETLKFLRQRVHPRIQLGVEVGSDVGIEAVFGRAGVGQKGRHVARLPIPVADTHDVPA